ncbi:hypothetical protein IQ07DRAFT_521112 [Pyrenochaeta sp. DS3sAY3a]|nr:hypothetical protein IQ07DRAFT_521112 [Pyrenochaeta sp. DS3sAY3a]
MSTSQTTADVTAAGLSKTDQNIDNTAEDKAHSARGHRANLSNPNTSDASKEKSRQALKELDGEEAVSGKASKRE